MAENMGNFDRFNETLGDQQSPITVYDVGIHANMAEDRSYHTNNCRFQDGDRSDQFVPV